MAVEATQAAVTEAAAKTEATAAVETDPKVAATEATDAKATEVKAEAAKTDEKDSQKWANYVRKEKELLGQQQKLKQERDQLTKDRAEVEGIRQARAQAKVNPLAYIEAAGLTLEDLQNYAIAGKPTPELAVKALEDKINAFEQRTEAEKKAERERVQAANQKAIEDHRVRVSEWVKTKADEYELIAQFGKEHEVPLLIEKVFTEQGRLLTPDEAAKLVEEFYEKEADEALQRYQKTKKYQAKVKPQPVKAEEKRIEEGAQRRTLSNDLTATTKAEKPASTNEERKARAVAAMERAKRT